MKQIKHILIFLLAVTTTLVINGGTKSKPCVSKPDITEPAEKTMLKTFPDLISFTNYVNQ